MFAALCAACLLAGCSTTPATQQTPPPATTTTSPGAPAPTVPRPDHVVVVLEENHSYDDIIGSSDAPYLNSLASRGALFTKSFALTHPSEPNYIALFSGSTQDVTSDSCPHTFTSDNLGNQLRTAGRTYTSYSESLPSPGSTVCTSGDYARKHNPSVNFTDLPASTNQPFSAFPTNYSDLPTVSFVDPNLQDDMHDGTVQQGDSWLKKNLDGYARWATTHNSLLIITWDEDDQSQDNQIPTIVVGGTVKPGHYDEHITHYTVLRTLEAAYGLPPLANAAGQPPITDIWSH
jgi:acid phosphatase